MRKSVTSQTEKALVAYIKASQSGTVLQPCQVYAGGLVDVPSTLTPPWVIFTASSPEQMGYDSGIYELRLSMCLATQVDDEMEVAGQDVHRERLEALRDMVENFALVSAAVNPPASGPDTRTVTNFTLSALTYIDDETKDEERKLVTETTYYVCASPSDG